MSQKQWAVVVRGFTLGAVFCVFSDLQSLWLVRFVGVCIEAEDPMNSPCHKPGCVWSVVCVCQLSRVDHVLSPPTRGVCSVADVGTGSG